MWLKIVQQQNTSGSGKEKEAGFVGGGCGKEKQSVQKATTVNDHIEPLKMIKNEFV